MSNESMWTKTVVALMLSIMGLGTVVLGVVGIVAVAGNGGTGETSGSGSQIEVHLTEFGIEMIPPAVPPGDVTFVVHNDGTVEHNFAIPSLSARTANLKPGETTTLVVKNLSEGDLAVLCEVVGHDAAGMKATLVVSSTIDPAQVAATAGQMTWQQMDSMMEAVAKQFPAKTTGTGNSELGYTMSADGYKVFDLVA